MKATIYSILLLALAAPLHTNALSYQCKGEGIEIFIRNLDDRMAASRDSRSMSGGSKTAYMEYKEMKINGVSMILSNSSAKENNMETFSGMSLQTSNADKKPYVKIKIRFYGDKEGIAKENIQSTVHVYDSNKADEDPEFFLLDSCKEIPDAVVKPAIKLDAPTNESNKLKTNVKKSVGGK